MQGHLKLSVAAIVGLFSLCGSAQADIITIYFQGTVSNKVDAAVPLPPAWGAPGTKVNGVLQYNTAAPPLAASPGVNEYPFNVFSMNVSGTNLPGHLSPGYDITVRHQPFNASLSARGTLNDPGLFPNFTGGEIDFGLVDFSGTALSSTNLPTTLNLASFQSDGQPFFRGSGFQIFLYAKDGGDPDVTDSDWIFGNTDSISISDVHGTPEPASWLLLGLGLIGAPALVRVRQPSTSLS